MDKSIVLSVAGSGKTYFLVARTNLQDRFLIVTYTNGGIESLREEVLKKYGYIPDNIRIASFFSFLYSFCYKPYLSDLYNDKGITWKNPTSVYDNNFLNARRYLYGNRISKLVLQTCIEEVKARIARYFDYFFIDEIQDFGGNDFNFIINVIRGNYHTIVVGDYYQHTFDTSRDKNINQSLHSSYQKFLSYFEAIGFKKDEHSLIKSRRCSKTVCDFIAKKLSFNIESAHENETEVRLLEDQIEIDKVFVNDEIVKLFIMTHYKFPCNSNNWGSCKGLTYKHVCVVVTDEVFKQFHHDSYNFNSELTKSKFYVACSRTKGNLYFVSDKKIKKFKNQNSI